MTDLYYTNPTLTNPADKTEIQENFSDVQDVINGNIDNSNIASDAAIARTKLDAYYQEVFINLVMKTGDLATSGWPAAGATTPLIAVPLPGSDGDDAWVATDVSYVCTDGGGGTGAFAVKVGDFQAGTWTTAATIVTSQTVATGSTQGKALENGSVSIAYASNARSIALFSTAQDVDMLDAGNDRDYLSVTVRLRRQLQST